MSSTISVTQRFQCTVNETFDAASVLSASTRLIVHSEFDSKESLTASSTVPATKVYAEKLTGTTTLDLTSLTRSLGEGTATFAGLKVQCLMVNNLSATNTVTVENGASNPYVLFGGEKLLIPIGGKVNMFFNEQLAAVVDSTNDQVKFTQTAGQSCEVIMVAG